MCECSENSLCDGCPCGCSHRLPDSFVLDLLVVWDNDSHWRDLDVWWQRYVDRLPRHDLTMDRRGWQKADLMLDPWGKQRLHEVRIVAKLRGDHDD